MYSFNPIATTNMTKALTKIIAMEAKQVRQSNFERLKRNRTDHCACV